MEHVSTILVVADILDVLEDAPYDILDINGLKLSDTNKCRSAWVVSMTVKNGRIQITTTIDLYESDK